MWKFISCTLLFFMCLFAIDSSVPDTVRKNADASTTYYPFGTDTIAVNDTLYSVWYWINNPALLGEGSISYEVAAVPTRAIALKLYKIFTNDTTWNTNEWVLVDSIVAAKGTTISIGIYGCKFMRFAQVGWQKVAASDSSTNKMKFTIK